RDPSPDRSPAARHVRRGCSSGRARPLRGVGPKAGRSERGEGWRLRSRGVCIMPLTNQLRDDILAAVPNLRAFAISLSGNTDRADDLVQETLLRAIANIDSFQPGSNLPAWLFTILRNLFRSDYRKRRREVEDAEGTYA